MSTSFTCFLIGADTLLMECGDILIEQGHEVRGVVTSEPRVARWAEIHGIEAIPADSNYPTALTAADPFDFLFAITHLSIIPDEVLELPRRLAVNFHDGPLPAYAGLNTPVWALMNREETYGVTWHVMTSGVDRGAILKQSFFDVGPSETALSINTRCLAAATEVFPQLIDELAAGTESRKEQDGSERSYFAKHKRPDAACAIDWDSPAVDVEAFVRALSYGPYANPLGSAKSFNSSGPATPFLVEAVRVVENEDITDTPGTVLETSDEGVTVATNNGAILITEVRVWPNDSVTGRDVALATGLSTGDVLGLPGDEHGRVVTELESRTRKSEAIWQKRLRTLEPPELAQDPALSASAEPRQSIDLPLDGKVGAAEVLAALAVYLGRTGRKAAFDLALHVPLDDALSGWFSSLVPLRVDLEACSSAGDVVSAISTGRSDVEARGSYLLDAVLRAPDLSANTDLRGGSFLPVGIHVGATEFSAAADGEAISLIVAEDGALARIEFDPARISPSAAKSLCDGVVQLTIGASTDPARDWRTLDMVSSEARQLQVEHWNETSADFQADMCVHGLFEAQVDRTPDEVALVFEGEELTYRELDQRANALAHALREAGVGPDDFVGVNVDRSLDLMVATLGTMKAGGAYVPLDPEFPADRLDFMIQDSGAKVILTQSHLASALRSGNAEIIELDTAWASIEAHGVERRAGDVTPSNLAYAIYTSGSTGKPKGVLVEHRNVSNFFTGMDAVVAHDPPGVWLAVTSLSFDISVLELFWTLARGFRVVIYKDRTWQTSADEDSPRQVSSRGMDFGLFMWGNDDSAAGDKYRLMLDAAKYFDQNGFTSAWTPERHFAAFGGPFPNPSVTGAALAAVTENLDIRAGSCVSPLHHPIRIAEEWAVVDNLSNGRVGLAFAAGWQPNDFVLRPESFPGQKKVMVEQIDIVRRLWRGEAVEFENPMGDQVEVRTLPRPVQEELPYWVTTAGNPESYRIAGESGANVLTHLLGQTVDEVAGKIAIYRKARADAGLDPATGKVTLMLHTFVGESDDEVREIVREPMKSYLGASMKLVLGFAWSFPTFSRPGGQDAEVEDVDLSSLTEEETDAILEFAFERYFDTSGLFGTVDTCVDMVERCKAIDVDEIACLLDYGVPQAEVMASLPLLKSVRDECNRVAVPASASESEHDLSIAAQLRDNGVTHLQCTPSMAQMLLADAETRLALDRVEHLMIGGEAFPPALAKDLSTATSGTITNMYGPTETTIWSSVRRLEEGDFKGVPIGRPIANTGLYVLDPYHQPLPIGVPGELFIGGEGVTRGYHGRDELTSERFVPDPFRSGERMYGTGDLVRFRDDGVLDFIGRIDHQVKIRGYRIELGEIESALNQHDDVRVAAVVVREPQPGDQRLVAFLVANAGEVDSGTLKDHLRRTLPSYMVPSRYVTLREMPLTPNGKIDRKALPSVDDTSDAPAVEHVAPSNALEHSIAECWRATLDLEQVGTRDNFFDIGGHSLLVVQLHRALTSELDQAVSLVDLYRFPTISALAEHLGESGGAPDLEESTDRAQKRRQMMRRRRR